MKKNFLLKNILSCLFIVGLAVCFTSCDDVNDWSTDDSSNRIFSPVTFGTSKILATSVILEFSSVPNARSYVIELSKDSLEFGTITNTVEILAEDIVLDSTATSKLYLATVKKLDPQIRYSARMKVTSNNDLPESRWVAVTFKTTTEQILNAVSNVTENSATVTWEEESDVTHIILTSVSDGVKKQIDLSASNVTENRLDLSDLKDNSFYTVEIYNGDRKKGTKEFTTAQKVSGDGTRYTLTGNEDIVDFLNGVADEEVVLVIPATANYELTETWTLPAHIKSLTLWGLSGAGGEQAAIKLKSIALDNAASSFKIWIHNMKLTGTDAGNDYILNDNPSAARVIPEFKIDNSILTSFRGVFRMRGALNVERIEVDNCIISNLGTSTNGSYGIVAVDDAASKAGDIVLTNNTVYNNVNGNLIVMKSKVSSLNILSCTFYDILATDRYIVNFSNAANVPAIFAIKNCLFGASNASISTRATNPKITTTFVADSYKTNDYTVASGYPLTGVSDYNNSSTTLFTDPANGDFTIKDLSIGDGKKPGDPCWW